jgi:WD40 repeat protein
MVVSAGADGMVRFWSPVSGKQNGELLTGQGRINTIQFTNHALLMITGADDNSIKVWQTANKSVKDLFEIDGALYLLNTTLLGHESSVLSLALSPSDRLIVSASRDKSLRVWEVATGQQLYLMQGHASEVTSLFWLSDGETLISASADMMAGWQVQIEVSILSRIVLVL